MRRALFVATSVFVLAAASLAAFAGPAPATDGCDCHSAVPPTATAAHAPFVTGAATCADCHVGWATPHPAFARARVSFTPYLAINPDGSQTVVLGGRLLAAGHGVDGALVHVQERAAGVAGFTDVGLNTTRSGFFVPRGSFGVVATETAMGTTYRAVAHGVAGTTVVTPAVSAQVKLTPALEFHKVRGLDKIGNLKLGRRAVALGRTAPVWFAGEKVRLTLVRGPEEEQRVERRAERVLRAQGDFGAFQWTVTPKHRRAYSIRATWPATADHPRVTADWWFEVK